MKDSTLQFLFDESFSIAFNMNDTFYYACGDSSCIDKEDIEDLESLIEKYGREALIAYEALKRGHDPTIPEHVTKEFKQCKEEILNMISKGDEYEPFYDLRQEIKYREEKGGSTILHTGEIPNGISGSINIEEQKKVAKQKSKLKNWFSFFYGN